ncbi:hypothetical protein MUK42_09879 [Musa troglodytarum]|uniref:Tubulin alpha-6 chain n=2 Tax=Musa troglodytarum TaxID=320322 RepID=A0A9E7EF51_9LILI|nr:hypothetical protein MUK42_09879 [Musa troglodytarum]URD74749.1 hypothetical protein MUK42_09879 [Musa troglodytarum]
MATFQLARSGFSPALRLSQPALRRPSGLLGPVRIRCRLPEDNGGEPDAWEEPPESLFMKELRRRGMTPTSLLEDGERGALGQGQREMEAKEDSGNGGGGRRERGGRNGVASVELEKAMTRPRERFMSVNSEGFEGLLPRAKLLLTIGGTFFLGFWPLILVTAGVFAALYTCFGPSFVHDASKLAASPPPYIDPYSLLEDEKLPHAAN